MPKAVSRKPHHSQQTPLATALGMLSRRELSERQVRDRLKRRGYETDDIDDAVDRLKANGSLNDARVAAAIARTETSFKKRGRVRVRLQLQRAGIASDVARQAIDAAFNDLDGGELLEAALRKRLKDDRPIADDREFQRLYRYLVAQGFESDAALKALSARRRKGGGDD